MTPSTSWGRATASLVFPIVFCLIGCGSSAASYGPAVDAQVALRWAREQGATPLGVGQVWVSGEAADDDQAIGCRALSVAAPADRRTFSEYVRRALIDELSLAGLYDPRSPIVVRVNISRLEITSLGDSTIDAVMTFTVGDARGPLSSTHALRVPFTSAFVADTACANAARAFPAVVQQAIVAFVRSTDFARATAPTGPPRSAPSAAPVPPPKS